MVLCRVNIFKDLPDEKLYQLAEAVDRESFETGETIVEQGEEGSMFYLIAGPKRTAQVCNGAYYIFLTLSLR
jgi:signal-transduction protein with cAMP-binding, CBS, and nucleotidyltransferase domain